jgi:two-component system nitrogen regulation sensor histidine kinase NtrY
MSSPLDASELKRRRREKFVISLVVVVLVGLTLVEIQLLRVSSKLPFVNSIFFFGLMNVNLVLIMVLLFLVFRNAIKLILDERKGKLGSRLRTRLVFCFLLFAIIPTALLFTVSAFYIKSSFDKWFNLKVGESLQRSIQVVKTFYDTTEKSAAHFARKIAFQLETEKKDKQKTLSQAIQDRLNEARQEFGLDAVEYYSNPLAIRSLAVHPEKMALIPPPSIDVLKRAFSGVNECKVQNVGEGELVRCGAYLGIGNGVVFADYFIPLGLASQLSEITVTYDDFKSDNPMNYPIKSTYFAILSMVTLLLLFSATWTGFYIAKRLTVPLEELVKGTEQISVGNLDYQIPNSTSEEFDKLIRSFNEMTNELKSNQSHLQGMNEELTRRQKYIEVLLESVQSGVVSLDEAGHISMINSSAARMLNRKQESLVGKPYWVIIPEEQRAEVKQLLTSVYASYTPGNIIC